MAYQGFIIVLVIAVIVIVVLTTGYIKAPPDTAYIISGLRKKIIIGKASIKIPFFERMDRLSLKLIPIDVKTSTAVPTADYINIQVDAAVNIKISERKRPAVRGRGKLPESGYRLHRPRCARGAGRQHARDRRTDEAGGNGQRPPEICGAGQRKRDAGSSGDGVGYHQLQRPEFFR